MHYT